jgi:acyl carrier protein
MNTIETVKSVIAKYLGKDVNNINDDDHLVNTLGLDSLDSIELVMKIEEELKIELNDDQLENVKTVRQLANALDNQRANNV